MTAFCILDRVESIAHTEAVSTDVEFLTLSDLTIKRYVATGEPMGKAGAYAIQGIGGALVVGVHGSYSSVVGLPLARVVAVLQDVGALADGFPFVQES